MGIGGMSFKGQNVMGEGKGHWKLTGQLLNWMVEGNILKKNNCKEG